YRLLEFTAIAAIGMITIANRRDRPGVTRARVVPVDRLAHRRGGRRPLGALNFGAVRLIQRLADAAADHRTGERADADSDQLPGALAECRTLERTAKAADNRAAGGFRIVRGAAAGDGQPERHNRNHQPS